MVQANAFGKKKSLPDPLREYERKMLARHARKHHLPPPPEPAPESGAGPVVPPVGPQMVHGPLHRLAETRLPWLSISMIALLIWVYWSENIPALYSVYLFTKTLPPLFAAGALTRDALMHGDWWRVFTAPLIHDGIENFAPSVLSLFIAGQLFERLVGRPWFAALFVVSAMCGIAGGLLYNDHDSFISGAGAGTMGLLSATFVCSFMFEAEQMKKHMQRTALWMLIPTLYPALWPILDGSALEPDLGMPLGGALAGAAISFLLCQIWPEDAPHPKHERTAFGVVALYAMLAVAGFAIIGFT